MVNDPPYFCRFLVLIFGVTISWTPFPSCVDVNDANPFSISQAVNRHAYVSFAVPVQLLPDPTVLYAIRSRCLDNLLNLLLQS
jgi:hypothetical protein